MAKSKKEKLQGQLAAKMSGLIESLETMLSVIKTDAESVFLSQLRVFIPTDEETDKLEKVEENYELFDKDFKTALNTVNELKRLQTGLINLIPEGKEKNE